ISLLISGIIFILEKTKTEVRYEKFRRQHIAQTDMAAKKCDSEIRGKQIYKIDNTCKPTNTFILDNPKNIKLICQGEGDLIADTELTRSRKTFKIIVCELKSGERKPRRHYEGRLLTNRYVVVRCENNLPVHFKNDIMNFGG
uniref:Ribonuclease A-domain domain-containing protein n=1 Tax=Nothobranchius furzeri TaxID=105023 RepID=A0A8C6PXK9_NOTFU